MLNKASADIMKWCDKNMEKYNKELKESRSTKKTLRRAKKAYHKSRKAPLKAYIGKRYFIYYIEIRGQDKTGACVQHRPLHDFREIY